jgi:hypothetical protein
VTARAARTRLRRLAAGTVVAIAVAAPRASQACYVCMSGRDDDSGRAFMLGSVLLSLLPFALFGGIGVFVWRRVRAAERARAREAQAELRA